MGRRSGAVLAGLLWLAVPVLAEEVQPAVEAAKAGAAVPVFSPAPGRHTAPVSVRLTSATAGATIYYTTDGSSPSRKTSPVYKGPIQLRASSTLNLRSIVSSPGESKRLAAR